MTTKAVQLADYELAKDSLIRFESDLAAGRALLLISADYGQGATDYFKVNLAYSGTDSNIRLINVTWAIAKTCGYQLRDKNGYWHLAISGGGYSKSAEIARDVAEFLRLESVRYEIV